MIGRSKLLITGLLLVGAGVAGFILKTSTPAHPLTKVPAVISKPTLKVVPDYHGLPIRLKISSINIDTSIEYLGRTSDGDMASPLRADDISWYKYGAIPGDSGTAVMAGHVVGERGQRGVFYKLDQLVVGDKLEVADAKNGQAVFSVRAIDTYDPTQSAKSVFDSGSGSHLNLITCAGGWDASNHQYLKRLVVFTDKI